VICQLPEFLDSAAVSAVRGQAALHPGVLAVVIDAGRVARFDPVGVLRLWEFCTEQNGRGVRVDIVHWHPALAHRLRAHPLSHFAGTEEQVFSDPFASLEASQR
jgi:hypothetical protein